MTRVVIVPGAGLPSCLRSAVDAASRGVAATRPWSPPGRATAVAGLGVRR